MIRTIALLKWLTARLEQLAALLDDIRQRAVGAALTATTEKLVAQHQKIDAIDDAHVAAVRAADAQRAEELKMVQVRYSDALQRAGQANDSRLRSHYAACGKLRSKREVLRKHIATS